MEPKMSMEQQNKTTQSFFFHSYEQDWKYAFVKKHGKLGTFLKNKVLSKSKFDQFSTLKYDFENQNFEIVFKEAVHSFGKSDGDII